MSDFYIFLVGMSVLYFSLFGSQYIYSSQFLTLQLILRCELLHIFKSFGASRSYKVLMIIQI